MLHKFIEGAVVQATTKTMIDFGHDTYCDQYLIKEIVEQDGNYNHLIVKNVESKEEELLIGTGMEHMFNPISLPIDNINYEVEEILKFNKLKSISAVTIDGKIIQIDRT